MSAWALKIPPSQKSRYLGTCVLSLYLLQYLSGLERVVSLRLNNFNFVLPKDTLFQVWLKLVKWFWRNFFNVPVVNAFSIIALEKGVALYLNNVNNFAQGLPSLFEIIFASQVSNSLNSHQPVGGFSQ